MIESMDREKLTDWLGALSALGTDIRKWSGAQGWSVEEESIALEEHDLGRYEALRLRVFVPNALEPRRFLVVQPVARNVAFTDGRVDLIAWPSFDRLRLIRLDDEWRLQTLGGPDWPAPWGEETFIDLAQRLVATP